MPVYQEQQTEIKCVWIKVSSNKSKSYPLGRRVDLFKEMDKLFIDFNLAFSPLCYNLFVNCPVIDQQISPEILAGQKYDKEGFDGWFEKIKLNKEIIFGSSLNFEII